MYYEVYIDVLFIVNLVIDFLLLRFVNLVMKGKTPICRSLAAAVLGAGGMCALTVLFLKGYRLYVLPVYAVTTILMVRLGCRCRGWKETLQCTGVLLLASIFVGGALQVLQGEHTRGIRFHSFLLYSIALYLTGALTLCLYRRWKSSRSRILDVVIETGGRRLRVRGLYDTGDSLCDPLNGRPVSVLEYEAAVPLLGETPEQNEVLKPHYLSYHAIGTTCDVLLVVTCSRMMIRAGTREIIVCEPAIALSKTKISSIGAYQLILHPQLIDE